MIKYVHTSRKVSVRIYHLVCPAKYRRIVFDELVDEELKRGCAEISQRFEIRFFEIGTDRDHIHFLIQSFPPLESGEDSVYDEVHKGPRDIPAGSLS
ncbi:MAG: transposase [Fibrobacteraceae bacterium]